MNKYEKVQVLQRMTLSAKAVEYTDCISAEG